MFERFTDSLRRVIVLANSAARDLGHNYIGTEHLLLAMIIYEGAPSSLLCELGLSHDFVRNKVLEIVGQGRGTTSGHIPFTPNAKKALELSAREAISLGHNRIYPEHLLLSMTYGTSSEPNSTAMQILLSAPGTGIDLDALRAKTIETVNGAFTSDTDTKVKSHWEVQTSSSVDPDVQAFLDWYKISGAKRFGPNHPVSKLFKRLG